MTSKLGKASGATAAPEDFFWGIGLARTLHDSLVGSGGFVRQVDIRKRSLRHRLFGLRASNPLSPLQFA